MFQWSVLATKGEFRGREVGMRGPFQAAQTGRGPAWAPEGGGTLRLSVGNAPSALGKGPKKIPNLEIRKS